MNLCIPATVDNDHKENASKTSMVRVKLFLLFRDIYNRT